MQQKWKILVKRISRICDYETVPTTTGSWYGPVGGIWAKLKYKNEMYCYPSEIS